MGFLGYFDSLSNRRFEHREDPEDKALWPKESAYLNIERAGIISKQHFYGGRQLPLVKTT